MTERSARPGLRQRIIRGASAQIVAHATRVLVQFGMGGVLLPVWGLQLYGDWLILVGVAVFLGGSDFGYVNAAGADMNMAVGRGDHEHALDVFRAVARGIAIVFSIVLLAMLVVVLVVPLVSVLGLKHIDDATAGGILMLIAADVLLLVFSVLLYAGFSCVGHYGEGILIQAAIVFSEYAGACTVAVLGGGPLLATAVLLAARIAGTVVMYIAMRRRAPWLSLGKPTGSARVAKRLTRPALSLGSIGWGTALNVQATIVIVGITTGPASAAIFGTVRTLSRVLLQLTASISQAVGPEFGRAYAEGNERLLFSLQRRVTQAAVWSSIAMLLVMVAFGDIIIRTWTSGRIHTAGVLLDLLLISAVVEGAWLTAGSILFFTNRHTRIGLSYAVLSVVSFPLAYVLATIWGRIGVAVSLIAVAGLMLVQVLRLSLPVMHETLPDWVRSLVRPADVWQAIVAVRAQLGVTRGS